MYVTYILRKIRSAGSLVGEDLLQSTGRQFESLLPHVPIYDFNFLVSYFYLCTRMIPLTNGEREHHDETCMSTKVHNPLENV